MLNKISGDCSNGFNCPAVHASDRPEDKDHVYVQGDVVTDPELLAQLGMPAGEALLRVPRSLLEGMPR